MWAWNAHLPNLEWAMDRAIIKFAIQSPETISQLHVLEPLGITYYQNKLDEAPLYSADSTLKKIKANLAELHSYQRDQLSEQQKLSYDTADWLLQRMIVGLEKWRYHNYTINPIYGVQTSFLGFMDTGNIVNNLTDAQNYNQRLSKVKIKYAQTIEGLKLREEHGVIPPTFIVKKILKELTDFVAKPAEACVLYTGLKAKLEKTNISTEDQAAILADTKIRIQADVYPAYQALINYFTQLEPKTSQDAGVWKFPDGDAFYNYALQLFTTTDMSPQQIHALGLNEVERIKNEMRIILSEQGYDTTQSISHLMQTLANEPRFLYPDTDSGREQILNDYRKIISDMSHALPDWFIDLPKFSVRVEAVPAYKAKNSPRAYYYGAAMGSGRDGVFYANLNDIKATPKFDMKTLAYHEAIPGHHLQYSIAQQNSEIPIFRRSGAFIAYVEGWALYIERWAHEAGFENDPYDNLGRLNAELFRAVRLVVDTGIHSQRWTRDQAVDYMKANTGKTDSEIETEVDRYIIFPGQACAYTVGMLEIVKLRELAKQKLGDKFDIREFHSVILKSGAMPLALLDDVVNKWIEQKLAAIHSQ